MFAIEGETNVLLLETTLGEKARLARSFPYVFGSFGTEALVPHAERPLAPALPVGVDKPRCQIVADASLSQLMANLQRTMPSRGLLQHKILCESSVGQQVLGLERVQRLADERLGKIPRSELAAELGARVLAARQ